MTVQKLSAINKRQQITSGFAHVEKGEPTVVIDDKHARLKLLAEVIEDLPEGSQFIVWAHFREELRHIAALLREKKITFVEYHGGVNDANREVAVDDFQSGAARCFLGQPRSGGIGLTLTAAEAAIYYSNSFDHEERLQSEDRCHRSGLRHNVVYYDLVATDTIDEDIALSLQHKGDMASLILGDFPK
jgi:SNF2 family DNA or RNA helicase